MRRTGGRSCESWAAIRAVAILTIVVEGLGACRAAPPARPAAPAARAIGGYTFEERLPALQGGSDDATLAGEVLILPDTVRVVSRAGPCKPRHIATPVREMGALVTCPDFDLSVDPVDPVHRTRYSVTTMVTEEKSVCAQYAYDTSGKRVCVLMTTVESQHPVTRTGYVHLHQKTASGPPSR